MVVLIREKDVAAESYASGEMGNEWEILILKDEGNRPLEKHSSVCEKTALQ
jgi:hypothetical protein